MPVTLDPQHYVLAKSIVCPICKAPPGIVCRGGKGRLTPVRTHYERLQAYVASISGVGLRDLAHKIYEMAREHPCYSQACDAVLNLVDHLAARAAYHELNRKIDGLERRIEKDL